MSEEKTKEAEELTQAIEGIIKGCEALGWQVAIPGVFDEKEPCPGMVLGSDDYIKDVITGKFKDEK